MKQDIKKYLIELMNTDQEYGMYIETADELLKLIGAPFTQTQADKYNLYLEQNVIRLMNFFAKKKAIDAIKLARDGAIFKDENEWTQQEILQKLGLCD